MDWARAKSIILFLLLAFNVFLLAEIYSYIGEKGIPASTLQNTVKILKSRGVELECKVPGYGGNIPKLEIKSTEPDRKLLAEKLLGNGFRGGDTPGTYVNGGKNVSFTDKDVVIYNDASPSVPLDMKRPRIVEKHVDDFLTDRGLIDSTYILDENNVNNDGTVSMKYLQKYKGYFVYGNYVNVVVTEKGIISIVLHKRDIAGLSSYKPEDASDAYQVLLANFDKNGVVITGIDLGYDDAGLRSTDGTKPTEELPAWRVRIKGSTPRFYSAIDGKEIANIE